MVYLNSKYSIGILKIHGFIKSSIMFYVQVDSQHKLFISSHFLNIYLLQSTMSIRMINLYKSHLHAIGAVVCHK